jgi:hypothetical protein
MLFTIQACSIPVVQIVARTIQVVQIDMRPAVQVNKIDIFAICCSGYLDR